MTCLQNVIRSGDPIPRIEYNEAELSTWKAVFDKVEDLLPGRACLTHRKYLELMKNECNFSPDNIPQLEDLSNFLKSICSLLLQKVNNKDHTYISLASI